MQTPKGEVSPDVRLSDLVEQLGVVAEKTSYSRLANSVDEADLSRLIYMAYQRAYRVMGDEVTATALSKATALYVEGFLIGSRLIRE